MTKAPSSRVSPRKSPRIKSLQSLQSSPKQAAAKKMKGSPPAKRKLVPQPEFDKVTVKLLRSNHFDSLYPGLLQIVQGVWGSEAPASRGYQEGRIDRLWMQDFFKHYEYVFNKTEVANHHIPLYFARAYALHSKGISVDWDGLKETANSFAKSTQKESDLTEVITLKSSNMRGKDAVEEGKHLKSMAELLERRSQDSLTMNNRLKSLEVRKKAIESETCKLQAERSTLSRVIQSKDAQVQVQMEKVDSLRANKQPIDLQIALAAHFEEEKKGLVIEMDALLKPIEDLCIELAELDALVKDINRNLEANESSRLRIKEMIAEMEKSDVISLHPAPLLLSDLMASTSEVFTSCTSCNDCLDSTLVITVCCGHPYCLSCLVFRVTSTNQCVHNCCWPEALRRIIGIPQIGE